MIRLFAKTSRNSGSAAVESLTEDIVIEILSRLPAKSLIQFKCVSKKWRSLICNPSFSKLHLQRLKAGDIMPSQRIVKSSPLETINYQVLDGGIGGYDDRAVVNFHEPKMDNPSWEPDLVGSCDGLVCLAVRNGFLLYNPTTKESRNLPGSDLLRDDELFHGFGYDPGSDDYKIVQGDDSSKEWKVAIFSLKSGSWRRIQVQSEVHLTFYSRGVYWKGALHWCVTSTRTNNKETAIISFDLAEEKFHQVSVPEFDQNIRSMGLGIHGANLFMYHSTYNGLMEAWITNEYRRGVSWTILFSVSTEGIPDRILRLIPVAYTRSGEIVFQINVNRMILFNPQDDTYKDYRIKSNFRIESAIYVETLVSPYVGYKPSSI